MSGHAAPLDNAERRFADVMRQARERRGWAQGRVVEAMTERGWPWHQSTVYRVEAGRQAVRLGEALALAAILGIDMDAFESGDPGPWKPCPVCGDKPPSGFTCNECGRSGT